MKTTFINTIEVLVFFILSVACKETVDILAPYEENLSVFGLLDPSQTTQKIKIYKVFSGFNGANSAKNLDSIYYKNGELDVQLLEYSGDDVKTINLSYANDGILEPGGDYNTNNAVYYYTNEPILVDRTYKLVIKTKTKTVTSELIKIADSCNFKPVLYSIANLGSDIVYRNDYARFGFKDTTRYLRIQLGKSPNVKGINLKIRFTYSNYNAQSVLINKESLIYDMKNVTFSSTSVFETHNYDFKIQAFCSFLAKNVKYDPSIIKYQRASEMDFIFTTFDIETERYLVVQNESTGLSQEKIGYSNIKNGLGFLGSRNTIIYYRDARDGSSESLNGIIARNSASKKLGFGK